MSAADGADLGHLGEACPLWPTGWVARRRQHVVIASSGGAGLLPKLVTFLGKDGSGKTTAATIAVR